MANLSTTYMGIELKNPLIVAASSISNQVDRVKRAEEYGAGALVIRSIFEEQIHADGMTMQDFLERMANISPEINASFYPPVEYGGPREHMMWVEKTRRAVSMPIFASLNAVNPGAWVEYAKQLEETGIDGLEVNYYTVNADINRTGSDMEKALYDIVSGVKDAVKIPVAVKLGSAYTSIANVVNELDKRGANAVVLFNRFLQPTIDIDTEELTNQMTYSHPEEMRMPLRWVALLYGRVKLDMALNTGVHTGRDIARGLLGGATVVQVASALLQNGLPYISTMLMDLQGWMGEKGYESIDEFRGNLSQQNVEDPFGFERAHYMKLLMSQE
ncbi:MAG TPA: dihydroorotate dehydrogenase-like protein [Aggregatilinea sp.]|jgi:dihydroorotate dehydrogenase (fumarate)|uniref:dihydroorotate dehydrogenase-like protein n=1 Tax=Aggregatilinea sp. TaxID=2806333 RepID=UPI002B66B296|nr:dihydroorotate dehydrogenase-like protein [Aggregatilinea sp.]HML21547.1 dihydroorotate dehydrogenase-like protein [Aggregatilinea sp.]